MLCPTPMRLLGAPGSPYTRKMLALRTVAKGTLRALIRAAGMSIGEFVALL